MTYSNAFIRPAKGIKLALASLFLSGAASVAFAQQTTVTWLHIESNATWVELWQDIASQYEAENPDVRVEMQFLDNEAFKARLPTLLQSAEAPHFFYSWGGGVLAEQAATGMLMDLTEVMNADGGAWRESFSASSLGSVTFGDKIWAVPFKSGTVTFFYNRELIDQAGVDVEAIETWDDFLEVVQQIKDAGITPIAGAGGEKWPLHFYWSYLVMRNGGQEVFEAAKAGEGEGFLHPAFITAGEQLVELGALDPFQPGWLAASWPDTLGVFSDGRAALLLGFENTEGTQRNASSDGQGLATDNIGRFRFPVVEGGPGLVTDTLGRLNAWAVSRNAPQEALDFLAYLNNVDNQKLMAEAGMIIPVAVGADSGVLDPLMRLSAEEVAASTWHQNFFDQDLGPNVGRVVNDTTVEILAGQMSPEEGAQEVQQAFDFEQF